MLWIRRTRVGGGCIGKCWCELCCGENDVGAEKLWSDRSQPMGDPSTRAARYLETIVHEKLFQVLECEVVQVSAVPARLVERGILPKRRPTLRGRNATFG